MTCRVRPGRFGKVSNRILLYYPNVCSITEAGTGRGRFKKKQYNKKWQNTMKNGKKGAAKPLLNVLVVYKISLDYFIAYISTLAKPSGPNRADDLVKNDIQWIVIRSRVLLFVIQPIMMWSKANSMNRDSVNLVHSIVASQRGCTGCGNLILTESWGLIPGLGKIFYYTLICLNSGLIIGGINAWLNFFLRFNWVSNHQRYWLSAQNRLSTSKRAWSASEVSVLETWLGLGKLLFDIQLTSSIAPKILKLEKSL